MRFRGLLAAVALGVAVLMVVACADEAATGTPAETPAQGNGEVTRTATPTATAAPGGESTGGQTTPRTLGTSAGTPTTAKDPAFVALDGASAHFGQIDRAAYRIEMPDAWNGELVLYAHGFAGFGTEVSVESPPRALRQYLVTNGYAWAASSYSENGYVPGIGADDTLALKRHFVEEFGEPERTYIAGASMGGNVVALALENQATEYDGGLALCGALGGIEQIDYLASWVAVAEYTSGLTFPIGEPGANLAPVFLTELPRILGAPDAPTERGRQFASVMNLLTGGPRPFFVEGFREQYIVNFGLVMIDPERKLLVNRAATNADTVYEIGEGLGMTAAELNAGVRRYASDAAARNAETHPDAVPTTGRISVPLLTLHNTGDLFVPISMEQSYRAKVEAAGRGDLLVQRAIRAGGHCKFSEPELTAAFADLVAWVKDGTKPKGEDLTGDLMNAGLEFTNPLRAGDPGGVE
jgi:alpha-beta hydrolase superfamily lysophospholipase